MTALKPLARQRTELLVVQSTGFCNIDCSYCYLPDRSNTARMSLDTVELIARRVLREGWTSNDVTVIWHAGEPLVVPPGWYRQAFEILSRAAPPGVTIAQAVQTNGMLIDADWVRLFREHDVRVGVSLDGPQSLHDSRRRTRKGRGTFERTIAGIHRLQEARFPFHVITVLSAESLDHPDELFDFYIREGIERVCFNIEEIEGANGSSSLSGPDTMTRFGAFMDRFIELNAAASRPLWIREIAASVGTILSPPGAEIPNQQVEPLAILTVDVNGNLSTFSPELIGTPAAGFDDFRFINLQDGGPAELLASKSFNRAYTEIRAGVDACRAACPWFRWCGGGAPANKFFENGSMATAETLYCRLNKQVVMEAVLRGIESGKFVETGKSHVARGI